MKNLAISSKLEEKIYDLKVDEGSVSQIITYFPLRDTEKKEIFRAVGKTSKSSIKFKSIFSDEISDLKWENSKEQIKKKFHDELVDID